MIRTRSLILATNETTYGTDSAPSTTNCIEAFNIVLTPQSDLIERRPHGQSLSRPATLNSKKRFQLTFDVELKGSGAAGTAPKWGPLMKACGFSETAVPTTSVTYAPSSTALSSASIKVYKDGLLYSMLGAVGNVELEAIAGQVPLMKYTFSGLYAIPTDVTFPTSYSIDTTTPVPVQSSAFSFGSYSAIAERLTINMNNEVSQRDSLNAANAVAGFTITDRNPKGSFNPEAVLRATSNADFWSYWATPTTKALSVAFTGSAGNIATITAPVAALEQVTLGERNGIDIFEIPFQLAKSNAVTGNDELAIVLT